MTMRVTVYFEPNGAPVQYEDVETTNIYDNVLTIRFKAKAPIYEAHFNWEKVAHIEKEFIKDGVQGEG